MCCHKEQLQKVELSLGAVFKKKGKKKDFDNVLAINLMTED